MPLKLAARARLRRDPLSGKTLLLWPERGMELNDSAARVVALCDGAHDLDGIVAELEREFPSVGRERLAADARAVLDALAARALLEGGR